MELPMYPTKLDVLLSSSASNEYTENISRQNITHRQQFIPSSRKSCTSEWTERVDLMINLFAQNLLNDKETFENEYVQPLITQLKQDYVNMKEKKDISDLGIVMPRAKNSKNPAHRLAIYIALKYFKPKTDTPESVLESRIRFTQFLQKLSIYYKTREKELFDKKTIFRQSRNNEGYGMWCSLKSRPISSLIKNPVPMKVQVAPIEELQPFLNYLSSNKPIEENYFDSDRNNLCMKFTRGALYHDGRSDLCKQGVGSDNIQKIMDSLACSDKIQHFLLGNNIVGTVGSRAIANYIKTKPNIKTWYLAGNEINADGIKYIAEALETDTVCTDLWLKRNPIGQLGAVHLRKLIETNRTISTLDLHNTGLLDDGLFEIMEGMKKNTSIKTLYLNANGLGLASAKYISEYFDYLVENSICGVEYLWIDMNRFDDEGIIPIIKSAGKYPHLKVFDIGSNGITERSAYEIYSSFKSHPNLKVLDIGMYKSTSDLNELTNRIGDAGAVHIGKLIEENPNIEYLSITHNGITQAGIESLANGLQKSNSIVYFTYSQYGLIVKQETTSQIKEKINSNRKTKNIKSVDKYIRFLKHTPQIVNIDSIYRNNSK